MLSCLRRFDVFAMSHENCCLPQKRESTNGAWAASPSKLRGVLVSLVVSDLDVVVVVVRRRRTYELAEPTNTLAASLAAYDTDSLTAPVLWLCGIQACIG